MAAGLIESDVSRFFRALFSKPDPKENKQRAGGLLELIKSQEPSGRLLLSPEELDTYVTTFKKSGFKDCLHWYGTSELNYNQEVEDDLPREINQPGLMVTCGQDRVLTPALSVNMEKWIAKLTRGHIEEAGHWVQTEKPKELNGILLKWLDSLSKLNSKL